MGEARDYINKLIKERAIPEAEKKKKKQNGFIKSILQRFKRKKKKKGITLPSGVRTPEQIKELQDIMGWKKKKPTTVTGVRG